MSQLKEMLTGCIVGPSRFEVRSTPVPRLQNPDEILVRTAACGICSGDLMPWYLEKKIGTVLGHEVVGRAVEVGPQARHIRPGDLVFIHHHAPCLACDRCRHGQFVHCPAWRQSRLDPGGMAEWIRVPGINTRHDSFAVNGLALERAVFIEPLGCSLKALGRIEKMLDLDLTEARGVVVGCGVMGLLNLEAARALGVKNLAAVEPEPFRRHMAGELGAGPVFTPAEAARELVGQADFVIIGPGRPDVILQALPYLRPGGVALLFTPTPVGLPTGLDLGDLYFRELSLVPSYSCGPEDTRRALDLLAEGRIQPEKFVTHRFALNAIQNAYDTACRAGEALKVLITFNGDLP